jgi:hypothetical protein
MATLLDTSLLSLFMPVFIFLLVFVIIYALLSKTQIFGKEKVAALNFMAAVCIAAVSVFAGSLTKVITTITPWIVFIIIILFIIFGLYTWLGVKNEEIWTTIGGNITIFIIILIVVLIGLVTAFEKEISPFLGQSSSSSTVVADGANSVQKEAIATLIHPRVIGALIILVVAAISVKLIVDKLD